MTCRAQRGLEVTSETVRKTTHEFSNCQPQSSSHRLIVYAGQLFTWQTAPSTAQPGAKTFHSRRLVCSMLQIRDGKTARGGGLAAHLEPLCAHRPLPLVLVLIPKPPAYLILRKERRHLRVRRDRIVVRDLDGAVGVELPEDGGNA